MRSNCSEGWCCGAGLQGEPPLRPIHTHTHTHPEIHKWVCLLTPLMSVYSRCSWFTSGPPK
jgi:hypothetical protein